MCYPQPVEKQPIKQRVWCERVSHLSACISTTRGTHWRRSTSSERRPQHWPMGMMPVIFSEAKHMDELLALIRKATALSRKDVTDLDAIRQFGDGWVAEETLAIAVYCALKYSDDLRRASLPPSITTVTATQPERLPEISSSLPLILMPSRRSISTGWNSGM